MFAAVYFWSKCLPYDQNYKMYQESMKWDMDNWNGQWKQNQIAQILKHQTGPWKYLGQKMLKGLVEKVYNEFQELCDYSGEQKLFFKIMEMLEMRAMLSEKKNSIKGFKN